MRIFILAVLVSVVSITLSVANTIEPVVTSVAGKVVIVDLKDYPAELIEISIYDKQGQMLHSEKINSTDYKRRRYSLEQLPSGSYTIKMNTALRIISKKIDLDKNDIHIEDTTVSFKPICFVKDSKWNVEFLAQNRETFITIYNANGTFYEEKFQGQQRINKSYNLDKLEKGKYHMLIEVGGRQYTDTFTKS